MNPELSAIQGPDDVQDVGTMLAIPGYAANAGAHQPKGRSLLSGNVDHLIQNALVVLEELVAQTMDARDADEFLTTCNAVIPRYYNAARGLSLLLSVTVRDDVKEVLRNASFTQLATDFRNHGLEAFGSDVQSQVLFTVWTLRKISDTCRQIDRTHLAPELEEEDRHLFTQYASHAMRTRFFLDCLAMSVRLHKPFHPTILPVIVLGLRNAVNAYAFARRALDLRLPLADEQLTADIWDEEDVELLREATRDLVPEPS